MERTKTQEQEIRSRLESMNIDSKDIHSICLYDWDNWSDHYKWIMSANEQEIQNWIDSVKR